jgi:hypothetical protein
VGRVLGVRARAIYNAVVGVKGRYEPYRLERRAPRGTSATAAAAAAGHKILETYSPYAQSALDAALAASLARIPDGVAKTAGVAFGERAAQALIDQRADDGRNAPVLFTKPPAPGVWRPTPPAFAPMTVPWLGGVTPLQVRSATQFGPATSAPLSIGGGAVGAARRRHALRPRLDMTGHLQLSTDREPTEVSAPR